MSQRPNILLAISDDQAWPFASAYGCPFVNTPAFDELAQKGVLFNHGYCPAPQCGPSRAALLTGKNIWEIEEAGTHGSYFPRKLDVYPALLEAAGYNVGYTGKPWSPGNWKATGWENNPAGRPYEGRTLEPPTKCISPKDYAGNFEDFLDQNDDQPFCFWFGCHEPHRGYEEGSGLKHGKSIDDVEVPTFLPDNELVRSDLLDYALEIEWFDKHLGQMIDALKEKGIFENTIIVVTGDNGMPFPRAKANNYELGDHVPMVISWPKEVPGGRVVDDFMSFIDLGPTFLDLAGVPIPDAMTGKSLKPVLCSEKNGYVTEDRSYVLTGRERHTHARYDNLGYPMRSIRNDNYLYIRNMEPERWPAGEEYHDVDGSPTKDYIVDHKDNSEIKPFFDLAFGKRALEELYDLKNDPGCIHDLSDKPEFSEIKAEMWSTLEAKLKEQQDPRVLGYGELIESYPRLIHMRPELGGFAEREYNMKYLNQAREAMEKLGMPEDKIEELCKTLP